MARTGYKDVYKITGYLRGGSPIYGYVEEKDPDYVEPAEKTTNNKEADAFTKVLNATAKAASNENETAAFDTQAKAASNENETAAFDTQKVGPTGTGTFNIDEFDQLLNKLEASKGRQQRQKSVEGRRDIFQQGLAGMMSNF